MDEEVAKNLLKEKGSEILEVIQKSLKEDNLTAEERIQLEKTAAMLAGYQMHFWLPPTIWKKVLMFLFLIIGIIGSFEWSPWFALLILVGCSFSPRIVGEVTAFWGKVSK